MDRRSEPQGTGGDRDDRFQKALAVILGSYKGESPETVYRDATDCFDSLIDISLSGDDIKAFALRNGTDLKYLVDGANFVISMLHFNPDNNFYVTLGISRNASHDEIRERWKRLMLLYHPDRQEDNAEWFAERAKKVNEAYSTLKDAPKRAAFDKKLAGDSFRRQSSRPQAAVTAKTGMHRVAPHHPVRHGSSSGKGANLRRYLPAVIVVGYIVVAAVFIAFMNSPNKSTSLESELQPLTGGPQRGAEVSRQLPEGPQSTLEGRDLNKTAGDKPAQKELKTFPGDVSGHRPADRREADGAGKKKQGGVQAQELQLHEAAAGPAPARVVTPEMDMTARQAVTSLNKEIARPEPPAKRDIEEGKKEPRPSAAPAVTKGEVEDFLRRYAESYKNGRLDEFMNFFSRRAAENGGKDYEAIRDSYKRTFSAKIEQYRLDDIEIKIDRGTAWASGVYTVKRHARSGEPVRSRRGRISWTLAKEGNTLKILEARYDN